MSSDLLLYVEQYAAQSPASRAALRALAVSREVAAGATLVRLGDVARNFYFLRSGLARAYALDGEGREYTKVFFDAPSMPGSMVSLLTGTPSELAVETLEASVLDVLPYDGFRRLLDAHVELLRFHASYMEDNWVVKKERREIALAQQSATERYATWLEEHPRLEGRVSLRLVASHLGITPTQLSRIRRSRKP